MNPAYVLAPGPSGEVSVMIDGDAVVIQVAGHFWIEVNPAGVLAPGITRQESCTIVCDTAVIWGKIYPADVRGPYIAGKRRICNGDAGSLIGFKVQPADVFSISVLRAIFVWVDVLRHRNICE